MKGKTLISGTIAGIFIIGGGTLIFATEAFLAGVFFTALGLIALAFAVVFAVDKPADDSTASSYQQPHFFKRNEKHVENLGLDKTDLKILELMKEGNSNQEIAIKTNISVNKVNTSVNAIFKKLDVTRRSKAIKKAQKLKLIA